MAWRCYKYPSNDLWHMLFQYLKERTDVLMNRNPFIKVQCNAHVLLHDLATINTLVLGP